MSKKSVYIAGPMRGIPYYNFPAFDEAAAYWRDQGWEVINPAEMDRARGFDETALPEDHDWDSYSDSNTMAHIVKDDLAAVQQADAIYMLRGWKNSSGAKAEYAVAVWLDKDVWYEQEQSLTNDSQARKGLPVVTGALDYFPDAICGMALCSYVGQQQHAPDKPLGWVKHLSSDHEDCLGRHMIDRKRDPIDTDGVPHVFKVFWRAGAMAQTWAEENPDWYEKYLESNR